jgi:hypothetical protein
MKKSLLLLISICCFCLLHGCSSGGASTTPAPLVATHLSVTAANSTPTARTAFNITVTVLDASNGVASNINSARRVQLPLRSFGSESFAAGYEGFLDRFPPRNIRFDNRCRHETKIVRLHAAGEAGRGSNPGQCRRSRRAKVFARRFHVPRFYELKFPASCPLRVATLYSSWPRMMKRQASCHSAGRSQKCRAANRSNA